MEKAGRHRHKAAFALHRLDDDRCHLCCINLCRERQFELLNAPIDALLSAHPVLCAIDVGHREPDDLR
jgi:hypothetical protein